MEQPETSEPTWVPRAVVIGAQFDQLQQHGGAQGLRENGSPLDAALSRPRTRYGYEPDIDLATLAASYAYAITKVLHPFNDGNKRTGFVTAAIFLAINGIDVVADDREVIDLMNAVADGSMDEAVLAAWIRAHTERSTPQ